MYTEIRPDQIQIYVQAREDDLAPDQRSGTTLKGKVGLFFEWRSVFGIDAITDKICEADDRLW